MIKIQFLLYLAAGTSAFILSFFSRFFFSLFFDYGVAVSCSYLVGALTSFILMKKYVFKASDRALALQIARFTLVNILGFLQVLCISLFLKIKLLPHFNITGHEAEALAHFLGLSTLPFSSYMGHKFLSFR